MGLDMYLYKRNYVQNWDHMKPEEKHVITIKKGGKEVKSINKDKIVFIVEQVATWRKANAIHAWFVNNVQDGDDDCGTYDVGVEQLERLRDLCKTVLNSTQLVNGIIINGYSYVKVDGELVKVPNNEQGKILQDDSVAKELLPTQEGFFFGGTGYDEWYWKDLEYTVEAIDEALKDIEYGEFEYSSSW